MSNSKLKFFYITFVFIFLCYRPGYTVELNQLQTITEYNFSKRQWKITNSLFLRENITDQHQLEGKIELKSYQDSLLSINFNDWIFEFEDNRQKWALYYNTPHLITTDFFRILHKDFYSPDKLSFVYQTNPLNLLVLISESVPIKDGIPSPIGYLQWSNQFKHIGLQISGLRYDSGYKWQQLPNVNNWDYVRNWGDILVLEGQLSKELNSISGAYATMRSSFETGAVSRLSKSEAFVINSTVFVKQFRFRPGYRYIDQGFAWPLTKTSRYTKDRVGFFGDLRYQNKPWQITYNFDALTNISGTKGYPASQLRIEYKLAPYTYFITKKWQPNQQYTLGYGYNNFTLELRSNGPQLRLGYGYLNHLFKFACSSLTQQRIEYQYTNSYLLLHFIYKIDHPTKRSFSYLTIRLGEEDKYLEIRYGESDGGQLAAKFDHNPNLYFGWSWRW